MPMSKVQQLNQGAERWGAGGRGTQLSPVLGLPAVGEEFRPKAPVWQVPGRPAMKRERHWGRRGGTGQMYSPRATSFRERE